MKKSGKTFLEVHKKDSKLLGPYSISNIYWCDNESKAYINTENDVVAVSYDKLLPTNELEEEWYIICH